MNPDWQTQRQFWRDFVQEMSSREHLEIECLSEYDNETKSADCTWSYDKFRIAAFCSLREWDI